MSLWELEEKQSGSIHSVKDDLSPQTIMRLREIGLNKDDNVTCLKKLPFGGPKLFQVSDSVFSLEEDIAKSIMLNETL